jgi:HJR/Mrr/RecB family endonuclease
LGLPLSGTDHPSKLLEFEERMFQYQRQVHLQAQKEMEEKLEQFKQLEIAKAKLEEEQKYQSTLKAMQLQYETQTALIQRQHLQELQRQDETSKRKHEEFEERLATVTRNLQEDHQHQLAQEISARQKKELQNEQLSLSLLEMQRQVKEAEEKLAQVRNISQKFDLMVEQEVEKFKKSFLEEQSNSLRRLKEDERLVSGKMCGN